MLCVCFTCGGGSRAKSRAEASRRSLAAATQARGWNISRRSVRASIHPSDRPTARTMPLCRAHIKVSRTRTLILFLFSSGAQKKQFLKRRARVREQCSSDGSQCECEQCVCKYKFEKSGRAGAELLFTRVIAPCCCCAGDELYYYVRLLQREMRKFDARRILTQFGFCLAAAKSFHLRSGQPAACCCWETPLCYGIFFFSHAQRARTNEWESELPNEIINFYLFFAIFAACVQRFFCKLKFSHA